MIPSRRRRRVFAGKRINRHPLFARGKGRGNVERPLSADQLGMQGREVQDDRSGGRQGREVQEDRSGGRMQDFVPPPFVEHDRPGM